MTTETTGEEFVFTSDNLIDLLKTQNTTLASLRRLREFAEELEMDAAEIELIDEMLSRIEHHRFTVAVVGEFKRGKSTFVNALLGEEILPSDVLPATATLNRVTYDLRPFVEIVYKADSPGGARSEEIGIGQLADYVTKLTAEARGRAAEIKQAVVHYPNDYLRKNVDIIDTPGLNDDEVMTAVTMEVLPHIDTAIMVLMPENPFGGYEGEFLNKLLLNDLGRVIFVVNAVDRIGSTEARDRLISAIEERIKKAVRRKAEERFGTGPETQDERELHIKRIGNPKVFGLSSADALDGKIQGDRTLLDASAFPEFERSLERILTHDRGVITLQSIATRVIASGGKVIQRLTQLAGASRMSQQEFEEAHQRTSEEIEQLRGRLVDELRRIDVSAERTRQKIRPLIARLGEEMKAAAGTVIDETKIAPEDLRKERQGALLDRISREVTAATDNVGRVVAERVQFLIEEDLAAELERVSGFASVVDRSLHTIDLQFSESLTRAAESNSLKGKLVSYTTGFTLFVGGGWLSVPAALTILGTTSMMLPAALVMFGVIGIGSLLTGQKLSELLFKQERVDNFRKAFRESALLQIDQQFHAQYQALERQFFDHVGDVYAQLKRSVQRELGGSIEQTQRTLDEIRRRRERNETLSEIKLQEYERMLGEAQRIVSKAHGLSTTLRDIHEV